eukprot:1062406-Rhodomonas_salina.1
MNASVKERLGPAKDEVECEGVADEDDEEEHAEGREVRGGVGDRERELHVGERGRDRINRQVEGREGRGGACDR